MMILACNWLQIVSNFQNMLLSISFHAFSSASKHTLWRQVLWSLDYFFLLGTCTSYGYYISIQLLNVGVMGVVQFLLQVTKDMEPRFIFLLTLVLQVCWQWSKFCHCCLLNCLWLQNMFCVRVLNSLGLVWVQIMFGVRLLTSPGLVWLQIIFVLDWRGVVGTGEAKSGWRNLVQLVGKGSSACPCL